MMADSFTIYEVFTETGGHWDCFEDKETAFHAAFRLAQRYNRPFLVRQQDMYLHDPIEVKPPERLLDVD